tara:strand:- start:945 stop:1718 length:774 start_codon:yes stop_codon:yes gene_type:complete
MNKSPLAGLTLDSLLITPVQRVPRYSLLLKDALKNTPEGHSDFAHLTTATKKMLEVADFLNNDIGETELRKKFLAIATKGASSLMRPDRRLLHEGELEVAGATKLKMHVYVFNDILIHIPLDKLKKKSNLLLERYHWPLKLVWLPPGQDKPPPKPQYAASSKKTNKEEDKMVNSFKIIGPTVEYTLIASSAPQKAAWLKVLKRAILAVTSSGGGVNQNDRKGSYKEFAPGGEYTGWWRDGWMHGKVLVCTCKMGNKR